MNITIKTRYAVPYHYSSNSYREIDAYVYEFVVSEGSWSSIVVGGPDDSNNFYVSRRVFTHEAYDITVPISLHNTLDSALLFAHQLNVE